MNGLSKAVWNELKVKQGLLLAGEITCCIVKCIAVRWPHCRLNPQEGSHGSSLWTHWTFDFCFWLPRSRWPDRSDPWSDEFRAHTYSRCARITWSGKSFKRTFVWTMVWNLSDQGSLRSGTVWSEAISSAHLSDRRQFRTHTSLIRRGFRAHTSLIRGGFRAHFSLIRGRFERTLVGSGTFRTHFCLIRETFRAQFCLIREIFRPHFCLIRGRFDRNFVWSEDVSSAFLSDHRTFRELK